jgi:hypothetical protein
MSGDLQFKRDYELIIGTTRITGLAIDFTVTRQLDPVPNSMALTIYNLNEDHMAALQSSKKPVAQLSAGYEANSGVIYLGECRSITSNHDGIDWVTSVESGDGEDDLAKSRVNKSFAPGVSYETVVLEVAKSMGAIGLGNLSKMLKKGKLPNGSGSFVKGTTVSGPSKKELKRLLLASGLEWSIQNRQFQVLEANKSLSSIAFVIAADTGMIGSPVVDNEGNIQLRCLLNPSIVPGRQLLVKAKRVNGMFRANQCTYTGSTTGGWFVDVEAERIDI